MQQYVVNECCPKDIVGTVIYALADPRSGSIRYVGKADNLLRRIQNHMCPCNLEKSKHVSRWIKALLAVNERPKVILLEQVVGSDWQERERKWILFFRAVGFDLTNTTPGGEGGPTMRGRKRGPWTDEQRARYSKTRRGMKMAIASQEVLDQRAKALREHWARLAAVGIKKKGPTHTDETKAVLRAKHLGKKLSPEHRRKMSLAKLGKKQLPEHIAKRAAAMVGVRKGIKHTEEHKAKLRAAWVRRKQRKEAVNANLCH